jgi:FkbM family methyltransferase
MSIDNHVHTLSNGMRICCPIVEQVEGLYHEIFQKKVYLQHGIDIHKGDYIFDVGANIGMFTLFVYSITKSAHVYSFEPIPRTFDMLNSTVRLNNLDVELFACGLSDETKEVPFTSFPRLSALSSQFPESREQLKFIVRYFLDDKVRGNISETVLEKYFLKTQLITCPVTTISHIMRLKQIERVDLLKIDAEQSEVVILQGIQEQDWEKIRQIVIEVHSTELLNHVVNILKKRKYRLIIEGEGNLYLLYAIRH